MSEGNINATDDFEIGEEEMLVFSLNKVFDGHVLDKVQLFTM